MGGSVPWAGVESPDDDAPAAAETEQDFGPAPLSRVRDILRRFWTWVRPDQGWLAAGAVLSLVAIAGDTAAIWLFTRLIDQVLVPRRFSAFWPIGAEVAVTAAVGGAAAYAGNYLTMRSGERFVRRLRTAVFAHLHALSTDVLETRPVGDLVSRLTTDVAVIEELVVSGLVGVFSAVVGTGVFGAAVLYLSWQLTLVALLAAPLLWPMARHFSARLRRVSQEALRREGAMTSVIEESLRNAALAQAYNQQARETDRLDRHAAALLNAELAAARLSALYTPLVNLVQVFGALLVVGVGAWELTHNALTLGALLGFAAFLAELYTPVQELTELAPTISAATASADRLMELLDTPTSITQRPGARVLTDVCGHIVVDRVSYTYPGTTRPALAEVSFTVPPGQTLAIVGPSGSGKSTIARLLLRFADPDTGTITLDGVDLRHITLDSLRSQVTLLPQQTYLLSDTVAANIAYGSPGADPCAIVQAAEAATAHSFIRALPDGYDTRVADRGRGLSGGERRRIAIARALLRDTPVLVLDEPTTGLDPDDTRRLVPPLRRLIAGRTTVLITHDLGLADALADRVLLLRPSDAGTTATSPAPSPAAGACPP